MRTYKALYRSKIIEVQAETSYAAQTEAARILKAKKQHEIDVFVCDEVQNPSILPGA